jgi:hypothetical protein
MDRAHETAQAETKVMDAFIAVVGDNPTAAREALAAASFRDRALILAWAGELDRLTRQAQDDYERQERSAWRDARDRDVS